MKLIELVHRKIYGQGNNNTRAHFTVCNNIMYRYIDMVFFID